MLEKKLADQDCAKRSRIHRKADVSLRNKHQLEVQVMFGEKNPKFLYNADYE